MSGFSPEAPEALIAFQKNYGQHLRSPNPDNAILKDIPKRRSQIYEELFFNNICGFINHCFPVAKSILSNQQWQHLSRVFFAQWRCSTPYFSEIPYEFVGYIKAKQNTLDIPAWLPSLLEYEWIELDVDICNAAPLKPHAISESSSIQNDDLAENNKNLDPRLFTTPTLQNLSFEWPVHKISNDFIPETPQATFLVVYRNSDHRVQFMEINAMTAALLEIIANQPTTANEALLALAEVINHPDPQQIVAFGQAIVDDFIAREILIAQP